MASTHTYRTEALEKIKLETESTSSQQDSKKTLAHQLQSIVNPYIRKTEWFSNLLIFGNYGIGWSGSFVTLRWRYFYWEILRSQVVMFPNTQEDNGFRKISLSLRTMFGVPLFITDDYHNEFRIGTGISAGYTGDSDVGIFSIITIPVEISYVNHMSKQWAFQIGLSVELPVSYQRVFLPVVNGFIGFRF